MKKKVLRATNVSYNRDPPKRIIRGDIARQTPQNRNMDHSNNLCVYVPIQIYLCCKLNFRWRICQQHNFFLTAWIRFKLLGRYCFIDSCTTCPSGTDLLHFYDAINHPKCAERAEVGSTSEIFNHQQQKMLLPVSTSEFCWKRSPSNTLRQKKFNLPGG